MSRDVVVIGGGFAGVTAARESALAGLDTLLLEARDRLGGRTWTRRWNGTDIELGGGWVHWHQPHTWSEITRAGLAVEVSEDADVAGWFVGERRRSGTISERDAVAERGWNQFVAGVEEALPRPHDPLFAREKLAEFDEKTIAQRLDELDLDDEGREVLIAELESLAHGRLDDAGAVCVLRWHALSGGSLALTQFTGGRVTLRDGTRSLLSAIASGAEFETRLSAPVAAVTRHDDGVEVHTRAGETIPARTVVVAVPLNALGGVQFDPPLSDGKQRAIALGQASRGIKIFVHARGAPVVRNAIKPGHAFGYLDTETLYPDGTQLLIGFGPDAESCDATNLSSVQRQLDEILPGYEALAATAHDWLADEFSRGTWAIHRPGWYTRHHAEMQKPEGAVIFAGSDLADGWAGFIDGAIESGLRAGARAVRQSR
ncbi:MAG TPA: NAD(P)/FAD-dependent oxidoreductase [Gaiellaceae bacterium]|nr:NAD(P)/FAD-dependent oxidoreductase [Gaiellaceae bacterium]